jgi:hypothetical protein
VRLLIPGQPVVGPSPDADYAELEALLGAEEAQRFAAQQRRRRDEARHAAAHGSQPSEEELRALEERAAAFQREAEMARREFELLVDDLLRRMSGPLPRLAAGPALAAPDARGGAGPAPATALAEAAVPQAATVPGTPADDAAPGTPGPPPARSAAPTARAVPPPPWHFWPGTVDPEDARAPERIVSDVREAVTSVLEAQGGALRSLAPDELVSVAVDFVPRGLFSAVPRPARTLVVRVSKKTLDERAAGRLTPGEFRSRVQVSEY